MQKHVIDLSGVRKRYQGGVEALRGVSMQVPRGGVFGLLGPNGAGKSTLVKILTSIVKPTYCEGTMLGMPIGHKPTLARVGYLPEHARFPDYLKGVEVVRYVAGLAGVSAGQSKKKAGELLELVGMQEWGHRRMGTYSKGMKQRIGLAQALVNDPEVVFLDEPTDGVDPQGRLEMRNLLKHMRDDGRTVFINSHLLGELEMICDSVVIMNKGEVVRQGTISELTEKTRRYVLRILSDVPGELREALVAQGAEFEGESIVVYQSDPQMMQPMIDALRCAGVVIAEMREIRQSLEEMFMEAVDNRGVGGLQKALVPSTVPPSLPTREMVR